MSHSVAQGKKESKTRLCTRLFQHYSHSDCVQQINSQGRRETSKALLLWKWAADLVPSLALFSR